MIIKALLISVVVVVAYEELEFNSSYAKSPLMKIKNLEIDSDCGSRTIYFNNSEKICQNNKNVGTCNFFTLDKPSCLQKPCMGPLKMTLNVETEKIDKNCCKSCKCYGDPHCIDFSKNEKTFIQCDGRKLGKPCKIDKTICEKQTDHAGNQCKWIQTNQKMKWNVGILGSPCVSDSPSPIIKMYVLPNKVYENSYTIGERGVITSLILTLDKKTFEMNSTECFDPNYSFEINDELGTIKKSFILKKKGIKPDVMYQIYQFSTGISTVVKCERNYDPIKKVYGKPRLAIEIIDPEERNTDSYCNTGILDTGLASDVKRTDRIESMNLCPNYQYSSELNFAQELSKVYGDSLIVTSFNIKEYMGSWCEKYTSFGIEECFEIIRLYGWLKTWCSVNTLQDHPINCVGKCQSCVKDIEDFGFTEVSVTYADSFHPTEEEICSNSLLPSKKGLECESLLEILTFNGKEWISEGFIRSCANIKFNSIDHPRLFFNQMRIVQCTVDCPQKKCEYLPVIKGSLKFKKEPKMCVCEYEEDDE